MPAFLSHGVEIGGAAAVGPVTGQAFQIAMLLQLAQRPLDRAAGELQVGSCPRGHILPP